LRASEGRDAPETREPTGEARSAPAPGAERFEVVRHGPGGARRETIDVIAEVSCALYVNRFELVSFMCSPVELERLAVGFLLNEGVIGGAGEVAALRVRRGEGERLFIDVELEREDVELPRRRILTSGCTGGVTFEDIAARVERPIESPLSVTAEQVSATMTRLLEAARLYKETRGVHTSALATPERLLVVCEDVGRHNTLDKIRGACALEGIDPAGGIVASTGRISSEMLSKAAKMRCPVVMSRTSPTALSVRLARRWGLTVIGYVRREGFNVYAGLERVVRAGAAP